MTQTQLREIRPILALVTASTSTTLKHSQSSALVHRDSLFALTGSSKDLKQRVRIKYAAGANEANGWKHFSQLTIGVEATK